MPMRVGQGLRLQRGAVLKTDGSLKNVLALGRILEAGHELSLFEEEVPREGVRVTPRRHPSRMRGRGFGRGASRRSPRPCLFASASSVSPCWHRRDHPSA
jgi:hypothetical protein